MCDPLDHGPVIATRAWIGRGTFAGLRPVECGTVFADDAATARDLLRAAWRKHIPCDPPDIEPIPGALAFMEAPADHVGKREHD